MKREPLFIIYLPPVLAAVYLWVVVMLVALIVCNVTTGAVSEWSARVSLMALGGALFWTAVIIYRSLRGIAS